jgi:imidazolonepropionase-like amidohydrolase
LKPNLNDKKKADKSDNEYLEKVELIRDFFSKSMAYQKAGFHLESNLRYEAMKQIFKKEAKVYVHANRIQEILDAIYFFDQFDLDIVLVGANDAWLAADLLKDRDIPIILRRVHSLPMNEDDDIDLPFKLPKILSEKGLLVALENSGSMEAMGTRNLPFYAGTASQYGVKKEDALSMITLNTAKILGVESQVGSIELGKDATLFISEGDALDMKTNKVLVAFVAGKLIDLDNPQKALYRKYRAKYKEDVH